MMQQGETAIKHALNWRRAGIHYNLYPMPVRRAPMIRRLIRAAAGIVFMAGAASLSACGQSGPLYLPPPGKHAPAPATAAGTSNAPVVSLR